MSTVGSAKSKSTVRSNASTKGTSTVGSSGKSPYIGQTSHYNRTYRSISDAWWSVGEYMRPGITHQSVGLSLKGAGLIYQPEDTDTWDLSDSLADMYDKVMREMKQNMPTKKTNGDKSIDVQAWLERDTSNGFIRVFIPDSDLSKSYLIPLTLNTPAGRVCQILGIPPNSLHVQLNGDIIQRLEPYENPLVIQNEYLATIGYTDVTRIQEEGHNPDTGFQIRFYTGKPFHDGTYSRNQLQAWVEVRKGKVLHQWLRRLCVISGTRLYIYRDKERRNTPTVVQLAKGSVEEVTIKGHERCLKLTSTIQGEKTVFLSFSSESQYAKWRKKCKKATSKLPTSADLSNNHLEFLPENLFINEELTMLNLRHNVLKERPIEDDIYTIGWLDDLPRFHHLRSLNLADNNLGVIPSSLYLIKTLVELNVASNKLEEIPSQISNLTNLQALHVHNNHLTTLPEEMVTLKKLFILVLAFNKFPIIPQTVAMMTNVRMTEVENLIMAGNNVERLSGELLDKMKYVKKVDLRMNRLTLPPSETTKFHLLEQLTHLDIRDNRVADLDIRSVRTLEYLNCERNKMTTLQVNGGALKNLFAAHNDIHYLYITPKPEWLVTLDVSHNKLKALPEWLQDCFFLQKLQTSYNRITILPPRIFLDSKKLKFLWVDHNELEYLPQDVDAFYVEELHIENNKIRILPVDFLRNANKLRVFNATSNKLTSLPDLNPVQDLNKIQELYLSGNFLQDDSFTVVCGYQRLKCLHIAHNDVYEIFESDVCRLQALQELNISENKLKFLPDAISRLPELRVLRAHSNMLRYLPDFGRTSKLKVLDVGLNRLLDTSVTDLMSSQIDLLDMSCNTQMRVDMKELQTVRRYKDINMVDMTGQNRTLPGLDNRGRTTIAGEEPCPWNLGFSETSGTRNKLCVASIKMAKYDEGQALLGVFDGGLNNEVPKILADRIPDLIRIERYEKENRDEYMKYTFLTAHRELRHKGQKLGASGALCHIRRMFENRDRYKLEVANAGDVSVVMSRGGEAVCLTKLHTIEDSPDECQRICKSDGIITEDNKVNGVCNCTKQLGCSYLFPHIIPDPHIERITLKPEDQCLIIANRGLWQYVSYQEAVWEVESLSNPVMAAKRLQDLAQSYGARENICILVLKLFIPDNELQRDILSPLRLELQNLRGGQEVDNESDHQSDVSSQDSARCTGPETEPEDVDIFDNRRRVRSPRRNRPVAQSDVQVRPLPGHRYRRRDDAEEWASIIQQRLSEEVKDKELKYSVADIAIAIEAVESTLPRKEAKKPTEALRDVENWLTSREPVPWERSDSQQLVMPSEVVRREQKKRTGSTTDTESTLLRPSQIKRETRTRMKDGRQQYHTLPLSRSRGLDEDETVQSDHSSKLSGMIKAIPRKHKAKTIHGLRGGKYKTEAATYLTTCIKRRQGQEIANILSELVKADHPRPKTQTENRSESMDNGSRRQVQNRDDDIQNIFRPDGHSPPPAETFETNPDMETSRWDGSRDAGFDDIEDVSGGTSASASDRDRGDRNSHFTYEEINLGNLNALSDSESSFTVPSQSPVDTSSVVDHSATHVVEAEVHNDGIETMEVPGVRLRRRNIPMGSFGRAAAARARLRSSDPPTDRPISDASDDVQSMTTAGSFEAIYATVDQQSQSDSYSSETVTISNLSDSAKETDIDSLYAKVRKGPKTPDLEWVETSDNGSAIHLDDTLRDSGSIESIIITHL